jgi:hypothetical protein
VIIFLLIVIILPLLFSQPFPGFTAIPSPNKDRVVNTADAVHVWLSRGANR